LRETAAAATARVPFGSLDDDYRKRRFSDQQVEAHVSGVEEFFEEEM
jgi:hypothetical protein